MHFFQDIHVSFTNPCNVTSVVPGHLAGTDVEKHRVRPTPVHGYVRSLSLHKYFWIILTKSKVRTESDSYLRYTVSVHLRIRLPFAVLSLSNSKNARASRRTAYGMAVLFQTIRRISLCGLAAANRRRKPSTYRIMPVAETAPGLET
jgi:hypothetical protein